MASLFNLELIYYIVVLNVGNKALRVLSFVFLSIFVITYASIFFFIGVKPDSSESTYEGLGKLLENAWLAALSSSYDFLDPWDKNIFVRLSVFLFSICATIIVMNLFSMYLQIFFVALNFLLIFFSNSRICK